MVDKFKSMSDQLVLLISEVPLRMENFEAINMNCPTRKFQQSIVSEAMLLLSDLVFRYLHSQICLDVETSEITYLSDIQGSLRSVADSYLYRRF